MKVLGAGYVTKEDKLELALLERTLRRGLSEVTKLFMHAAKLALDAAELDARSMPIVFASAFGEIGVAEALMAEAYERDASRVRDRRGLARRVEAPVAAAGEEHRHPGADADDVGVDVVVDEADLDLVELRHDIGDFRLGERAVDRAFDLERDASTVTATLVFHRCSWF